MCLKYRDKETNRNTPHRQTAWWEVGLALFSKMQRLGVIFASMVIFYINLDSNPLVSLQQSYDVLNQHGKVKEALVISMMVKIYLMHIWKVLVWGLWNGSVANSTYHMNMKPWIWPQNLMMEKTSTGMFWHALSVSLQVTPLGSSQGLTSEATTTRCTRCRLLGKGCQALQTPNSLLPGFLSLPSPFLSFSVPQSLLCPHGSAHICRPLPFPRSFPQ